MRETRSGETVQDEERTSVIRVTMFFLLHTIITCILLALQFSFFERGSSY